MKANQVIKTLLLIAFLSLVLHFAWEMWQMRFYVGPAGFWQHFPICFPATLGDVGITLFLYAVIAAYRKHWLWIRNIGWTEIVLLLLLGLILAIVIEWIALGQGRWQYSPSMPVLTFTNIGLMPVLQMMFLPLFSFYLSRKVIK